MSEEEKKAIEFIKSELQDEKVRVDYQRLTGLYGNLEIEILLNLIEKQSKEIEELKEDNKHQWEERCKLTFKLENSTSNDKIKAKIEEYKKQIEKMEKDDIGIGFTLGKEWSDLKAKVEFGQSLLEKE